MADDGELARFRVPEAFVQRDDLPRVEAFLKDWCVSIEFVPDDPAIAFEDNEPVSPSILMEVVQTDDGANNMVVTADGIREFLESTGLAPSNAKGLSGQFTWRLNMHLSHDHAAYRDGSNTFGRQCRGCECPLKGGPSKQFEIGTNWHTETLDPYGVIALADLDDVKIREIMVGRRFGAGSIRLLRQMATRLKVDLGLET